MGFVDQVWNADLCWVDEDKIVESRTDVVDARAHQVCGDVVHRQDQVIERLAVSLVAVLVEATDDRR